MIKIVITLLVLTGISVAGNLIENMADACERNVAVACYELGSLYQGDDGIPKDEEKTARYLKKACELGHDKACKKLEKVKD